MQPRRNALLKEGSKSDRVDARKLAELLYTKMLRPVYHRENGMRAVKELARSYVTISKDQARVMTRVKDVFILLQACVADKAEDDFVFTRAKGQPVGGFRKRWENLTTLAGLSGLLFHDLRRSAERNMVRRGVPETVAMKISGHKTRAVFDRYNVTSEADLADAARKIEAGKQVWAENGQNFDKMHRSGAAASLPMIPASAPN